MDGALSNIPVLASRYRNDISRWRATAQEARAEAAEAKQLVELANTEYDQARSVLGEDNPTEAARCFEAAQSYYNSALESDPSVRTDEITTRLADCRIQVQRLAVRLDDADTSFARAQEASGQAEEHHGRN